MESITTKNAIVHFNSNIYEELKVYIKENNPSIIFILVDINTHDDCLPQFLSQLESGDIQVEVMEMPDGEESKTIDICMGVWEALSEYGADRKSLLINLGGGVVTDLGGFVASTYMRGVKYINIPTSLLAMVDASVGGKTGVDLGNLKNQVGVISEGDMVGIDVSFLSTLPKNQMISGFAEMLKHGLIYDKTYWNTLTNLEQLDVSDLDQLIYDSVVIKNKIVSEDPTEQGLRKILNFGHTLGHAIESYFLDYTEKPTLLHGEAIAVGMILEAYLSTKICGLSTNDLKSITSEISKTFSKVDISLEDYAPIMKLMLHDKKNSHGIIKFVLLEAIGKAKIDCEATNELIIEAFEYYKNF
ncbi:3-dehydroquinate synthase [Winogradskyella immobilis]|uniref:3-dehydroquinate synthase n=1 Tax=Winogradskyella immobilis TaxID=2816852 RepID=A0ABS8ENX2_9FLAO|nr:3-dehydroquinate synthase [Winogradskyella immobilis]MCC1484601.1 3-dehydroquinate synthase [Winogradskyella immobilis]MCG0016693.1 3-dehydroquinate synthase [Winogradskyella immobilis]